MYTCPPRSDTIIKLLQLSSSYEKDKTSYCMASIHGVNEAFKDPF